MIKRVIQIVYLSLILALPSCKDNEQKGKIKIDTPTLAPKDDKISELVLIFGGDVMAHEPQIIAAKMADGSYDFSGCFQHITSYWSEADAVILNLETTLSARIYSGYPLFSTPYQLAQNLKDSGVTHLVTANNHSCDRGAYGIDSTIYYLNKAGIPHTGTASDSASHAPMYIEKDDFKVAILNYTYGTNGMPIPRGKVVSLIDTTLIKREIEMCNEQGATDIAVCIHWGIEYTPQPVAEQKVVARWLHEAGADLVIGSHPHVVQPMEYYIKDDSIKGVTIYSLGNFISNQRKRYTNGGINVKVTINDNGYAPRYKAYYKSWYVDKRPVGDKPRYVVVSEQMKEYEFATRGDSLAADTFYRDTRKHLGIGLEER